MRYERPHWESPPTYLRAAPAEVTVDLIGTKLGSLTVTGYLNKGARANGGKSFRWLLVRCLCGHFERRKSCKWRYRLKHRSGGRAICQRCARDAQRMGDMHTTRAGGFFHVTDHARERAAERYPRLDLEKELATRRRLPRRALAVLRASLRRRGAGLLAGRRVYSTEGGMMLITAASGDNEILVTVLPTNGWLMASSRSGFVKLPK